MAAYRQGSTEGSSLEGLDTKQLQDLIVELLALLEASRSSTSGLESATSKLNSMKGLVGNPSSGYIDSPLAGSAMMQSSYPGSGPVQWLGGMPPGYDDKVAQKLAKTAIAGNLGVGSGLMSGLGGLFKGLFGGGK